MTYILLFLSSLLISLLCTPYVIRMASRYNVNAFPNQRTVHSDPKPLLGGLAIFTSFIVVYIGYELIVNPSTEYIFVGIILGCFFITIVGIIDDKYNLSPKAKLIGQFISTIPLVGTGLLLESIYLPILDIHIHFGVLSIPLTIIWIVGIANAINLIDGLDGLCAGVVGISSLAYFFVSLSLGNYLVSAISIILLGSIVGFLKFNFFPAKIFMGDTGSLFLGFLMASLSLLELKQVAVTSFVIPLLILGIPISDTFYALVRRKLSGRPLSSADKSHLHHRLLKMGWSHRQTVLIIYGVSAVFSISAIISSHLAFEISFVFFILYLFFGQIMARRIGMIHSKKFYRNHSDDK
jgi:UDP-GlcNAc:undecaprenyl-phosphate/decaprenyl-phosphate GlcNAc-1-phosphate transferase